MKKKSATKATALTLAAVMSMGLLAGCGNDVADESGASEQGSSTQQSSEPSQEGDQGGEDNTPGVDKNDPAATAASNGINLPELDTLSITVRTANFGTDSTGTRFQQLWQEKMEAYLGCKLDITWDIKPSLKDMQDNEQQLLGAQDFCDVNTTTVGTSLAEYGEEGVVLNIADYMNYMVYYPDYMAGSPGGEDLAKNQDGSMYYFIDGFYNPNNITGAQSFASVAYRFDVLKDNNWKPATNLEEFSQLCADIKAKIDDGSLDADYVIMDGANDFIRGFAGIFHTWESEYYNGSEWVYGPVEDNFREMLRYLNGLWDAGYIDPEYATTDWNMHLEKATTGKAVICTSLWSGSVASFNTALKEIEGNTIEWGLAYLPDGPDGTAWKWGSRLPGKSLNVSNLRMGIFIDAETEHPEHIVAMIDYQYSDQMVELMNWGIEGETYNVVDGVKTYVDDIMNDESPAKKSAEYGLMASSLCRSGIPFIPLDNEAMTAVTSLPEPWWSEEKGYYEGKYWTETGVIGGLESVSPASQPPVVYLTPDQQSMRKQLNQGGTCYNEVLTWAADFIEGRKDIDNDADWDAYINAVKSKTEQDFDSILTMLNENTVK
ncbi:hypothetical protein NSB25_17120 [Acetatifactor muris]|jgi:putative aldouronate transport system substrate-binding protein|uniref:Lipoprotein LipO n=1 Tax=Acetatifactor muris TaxID=879566 RepID=A0A2K4ZJX4_9FIRM|nr:hypothetical protein [Acetatifactor muris]MCR2048993.1 hypothetical protein [Acetatifactor muris]SOY30702.1 hypothetical protein AMURIS_03433 [Acetatifactor muris]